MGSQVDGFWLMSEGAEAGANDGCGQRAENLRLPGVGPKVSTSTRHICLIGKGKRASGREENVGDALGESSGQKKAIGTFKKRQRVTKKPSQPASAVLEGWSAEGTNFHSFRGDGAPGVKIQILRYKRI